MAKKKATAEDIQRSNQWKKEHTSLVGASYKTEFVLEFKEACKKLNVSQSSLIREMMEKTIKKAKKIS